MGDGELDEEVVTILETADAVTLAERTERFLRFEAIEGPVLNHVHRLPVGAYGVPALMEAREAFVGGQYIATVCLCHLVLEHLIVGYLHERKVESLENTTFVRRAQLAADRGLFTRQELADITQLDTRRNLYSHPAKRLERAITIFRRESEKWHEGRVQSLYADAELAVRCLFPLINRPPFTYPDEQ